MSTLVLPICGNSSRFNGSPKWLKRHPLGGIMLSRAVSGIAEHFERVIVVMLEKHIHHIPQVQENLSNCFERDNIEFAIIDYSKSQPDTIAQLLHKVNIVGDFFVKDCDNFFALSEMPIGNCVVYADLSNCNNVFAQNKSYISIDRIGLVANIVEKRVISSTFCVGGYGFADSKTFLSQYKANQGKDYYLSHVVYQHLINLHHFQAIECSGYLDWGTQQDWDRYTSQFATLFIDLDGILVGNSAPDRIPFHTTTSSLVKNVAFLKTLDTDKIKIIITTSRPEVLREETRRELAEKQIPWDSLIMGLPHAQRIVVNDYREGDQFKNQYARAFALPRDEDGSLEQAIGFLHLEE